MVLNIEYDYNLPHSTRWKEGYTVHSCKLLFKKELTGPKNGTSIKISNLPVVAGEDTYLRFWAAGDDPNGDVWKNYHTAYDTQAQYEKEPNIDYYNGGIVKISKYGTAKFKLIMPDGYYDNDGHIIAPHLHYRLCSNNRMSHVMTYFFE